MILSMHRLRSSGSLLHIRLAVAVERCVQALLTFAILGTIYRYCYIDYQDPSKCGALLHQGEWLDPGPTLKSDGRQPFRIWQVPGCMMHEYERKDIEGCFHKKRLVFVGDSVMRQIYRAVVKKMERPKWKREMKDPMNESHTDLELKTTHITVQFIWDPFLNSTALEGELRKFQPYPAIGNTSDSAAAILVGAPGLWNARYIENNYFRHFRDAIERVIPHMDHTSENTSARSPQKLSVGQVHWPNLLLMAPVQVPNYEALSPDREATITPEKIDQMNNFLQQVSAHSKADIIWSYSSMIGDHSGEYDESGLHVTENIALKKADILLNLRCNAGVAKRSFPYDRTCCSNYRKPRGAQLVIMLVGMMILPVLASIRQVNFLGNGRYLPSSGFVNAATVFWLVVCFCFFCDRTQLFEKAQKQYHKGDLILLSIAIAMFGIVTIQKSKSSGTRNSAVASRSYEDDFISREQTDEWKGWMQAIILVYHYTHASESLVVYKIVRVLVASYLFMAGYGHSVYFLRTGDFSLKRFAVVIVRLNLLPTALTFMMSTDYLFYYFPPLVSFWYLVTFVVFKLDHERNCNPSFLVGKILLSALCTTAFALVPGILELLVFPLRIFCGVSWDITEWRFRLSLDIYVVYIGMLFAVLRRQSFHSKSRLEKCSNKRIQCTIICEKFWKPMAITMVLIIWVGFWKFTQRLSTKSDYNRWQPYISFLPILSFVFLRNSNHVLRNYHSTGFAWLGRISLETYVLQYHIWLAGDTRGLLRLGLFSWGIEVAILTAIFIWLSWCTTNVTRKLTTWIVEGRDVRRIRPQESLVDSSRKSPQPVRTDEDFVRISNHENAKGSQGSFVNQEYSYPTMFPILIQQNLRWRLGVIAAMIWFGNVTYR